MREILFRGKSADNGEWVYGVPIKKALAGSHDGYYPKIIPECDGRHQTIYSTAIKEETLGQYTGLKDVHGTRIFEGDIVKDITPLYKGFTPRAREEMLKERAKKRGIAVVKFGYHDVKADDPYCTGRAYGVYFEGDMELTTPAQYYGYGDWQESEDYRFEVIGNIWDNPELLKGEQENGRS